MTKQASKDLKALRSCALASLGLIPLVTCCFAFRAYPRGLGEALLSLHTESVGKPRVDLRQKRWLDPRSTDLQIFRGLDDDDPWVDAQIPGLFLYLFHNPKLRIPDGWEATMESMKNEMEQYVPGISFKPEFRASFLKVLTPKDLDRAMSEVAAESALTG